jgi:hypothetical protein
MRRESAKFYLACVIAPLAPLSIFLVVGGTKLLLGSIHGWGIISWGAERLIPWVYLLSWPLGLPAHFLLRRWRLTGSWAYLLAGAVLGAVMAGFFMVFSAATRFRYNHSMELIPNLVSDPVLILIGVGLGAWMAMTFWLIVWYDWAGLLARIRDIPPQE